MNIHVSDKALRKAIFSVFGGRCFYSGRDLNKDNFHIDHIVPKNKGGEDSVFNYVPCDSQINISKSNKYKSEDVVGVLYLIKTVYAQRVINRIKQINEVEGRKLKRAQNNKPRNQNEKLKQAIKEAGFTQEKLGVKLGVTGQTICNAVNGRTPHENTRKAIAKALNCAVEDVFTINDNKGE